MRYKTKYEDVNQVLELLTDGLVKLLNTKLVGLYLTGSLTYGDFNRESSDIDFIAVLKVELTDNEFEKIRELHKVIAGKAPHWSKTLEGSYITLDMLETTEAPADERPYVNGGKLSYCRYGNEWIINLYALQECGRVLFGKDLSSILPRVTIEQVRAASKDDLLKEWAQKIDDPDAFSSPGYDPEHIKNYATLTMCRILHRVNNDNIASKKVASKWVKKTYPEWTNLVERAERWVHGAKMGSDEEVKNFISFTVDRVR